MEYHLRPNALVNYAESFSEVICNEHFADQDKITGKDLVKLTNVPQVNAFLVKTVFESWQKEANKIQSPLFDYSSPAVKEQLGSLMKTLSTHISIDRETISPILIQAVVDTFILAFNPKQFFRILFGKLPETINPEKDLKSRLKYTKLHPDFIEKAYTAIAKDNSSIKLKQANQVMERVAEDIELFSDPEAIANQFQAIKAFQISDLVSDWKEEVVINRGIMSAVGQPAADEDELDAPEIDPSFEEKSKHYEDEDYIPEEEEMALYNEEDLNSEEEFVGNDERMLTESDLNGIELPSDEHHAEHRSPSLDDDSTHNLIDNQPNLELDSELSRTAILPNVERVALTSDSNEDEIEDEVEEISELVEEATNTIEEDTFTPEEDDNSTDNPSSLHEKLGGVVEEPEEPKTVLDTIRAESEPTHHYPSLKGTIPLNLKFKFQNELFNGDNAEFNSAIEMIDQCKDYHTAIALIKEKYIRPFDWDLGAEATRDFLSMVDKKFE